MKKIVILSFVMIIQLSLSAQNIYVLNSQSQLEKLPKVTSSTVRTGMNGIWTLTSLEFLGRTANLQLPLGTTSFYVQTTPEIDITSYMLSPLKCKKQSRLLPYRKNCNDLFDGINFKKTAINNIDITIEQISENGYIISAQKPLSKGEYAFFRMDNEKPTDIYDFCVTSSLQPISTLLSKDIIFAALDIKAETEKTVPKNNTASLGYAKSYNTFSDVDINIPQTSKVNENTFAIIIANENYQNETDVQFAVNDGNTFKKYCIQTLGIPSENVHLKENASLNNIIAEVDWLQKVCAAFNGDAKIIFYYAGHGIPDESSKDAYLLPVDGIGSNPNTGYKLSQLYSVFGKLNAQSISVFLDACFSGALRGEGMLASARGVAIKSKAATPMGKMIVFSAAQGDETAYPIKDKGHGLFTYYLLKKLQDSKGECTYNELGTYIKEQVSRRSIIVNNKSQTPSVSTSQAIANTWKNMKLK